MFFEIIIIILLIIIIYNQIKLNNNLNNINEKIKNIDLNINVLYDMFKQYILQIDKHVDKIPMLVQEMNKLNLNYERKLNKKLLDLDFNYRRYHILLTHVAKQILTDKVLNIINANLFVLDGLDRVKHIANDRMNIDIPRDIKGIVAEDVIETFLKKTYPSGNVINQASTDSNPDIMFVINNICIFIEVKNCHYDIGLNKELKNFYKYIKRPIYDVGIMVNLDSGKIIEHKKELNGYYIKKRKPAFFLPSLSYDIQKLKDTIDHIITFYSFVKN